MPGFATPIAKPLEVRSVIYGDYSARVNGRAVRIMPWNRGNGKPEESMPLASFIVMLDDHGYPITAHENGKRRPLPYCFNRHVRISHEWWEKSVPVKM